MGDLHFAARIEGHAGTFSNRLRADCIKLANAAEAAAHDAEIGERDRFTAELAHAIDSLQQLTALSRYLEGILTDAARAVNRGSYIEGRVIPGLGKIDLKRGSSKTRWDGPGIGKELALYFNRKVDPDTGEVTYRDPDGQSLVAEVVAAVIDAAGLDAGSKDWRVKSLATYGIDAKEYRTKEPGNWNMRITRGVIDTRQETTT